ncbi:MAG: hypothetical protein GXP26_13675 [Planctomycetes bacterium]|nr:hypothetical protein [Planctomycetota bacterium]
MATIIKRESQQYLSGADMRKVSFDLSDMTNQADVYLDQVRAEAVRIVQEAEKKSAIIRQNAEQAGRKAAEEAIERILDEKVAKQMQTLTPALAAAVEQIEDSRQDWLRHWESSVVNLAGSIATRIIRREITQHPEISIEWIEESLRLVAGSGEITVRLNPADEQTLGNQVSQLTKSFNVAAPTTIVGDESISVGGCRIETEFGSIDQQIETQVARIAEELS